MKRILGLGLALAAGLAAMALIASAPATAATDLCLFELPEEPALTTTGCQGAGGTIDTESSKVTFEATATNSYLKGNLEEKCSESSATGESKGDGTPGLEITALSFAGCELCTGETTFTPYAGELALEGKEDYFVRTGGEVKLTGCPFGVMCKFGSESISLKLAYGEGMAENEFVAEEEEVALIEGSKLICGTTGSWSANYVVESPSHWFLFTPSPTDLCLFELPEEPALTGTGCQSAGGTIDTESSKATFEATATNSYLKGNLEEKCSESSATAESKGDGTPGLEITALSFAECKPCTIATTFTPYAGELALEGKEDYFVKTGGEVKLTGCPYGVTCKFGSESISLKLVYGEGMAENEFVAEEEEVALIEGSKLICGTTGSWSANYVVESPSHWFLFAL